MSTTHTPGSIADLRPGDHLCCLYETEKEHRAVLAPFLRQGLERGEKVLYIVDARTGESVLAYLRDDGLGTEPYLHSGQLAVLTHDEAYMRHGTFDPQLMIALLQAETEQALAEGYPALRVTGEMTWALRGLPGSERLIEYEARLNDFFADSRCLAICQYDRRAFHADVLLDVLRTHPVAVVGTEVYNNFYYIPPAELLSRDLAASELRHWLENLAEWKRTADALRCERDRAQTYLDMAGAIIVALDTRGDVTLINRTGCRLLECDEEAILGRNWFDHFLPESARDEVRAVFARLVAGEIEPVEHLENPVLTRRGQERIISWHTTAVTDEAGNIIGTLSSGEDVTERLQAEQELCQRAAFQSALNSVIGAAMETESDLRTLLNVALDQTLRALGLDMGAIWLKPAPEFPAMLATRGLPEELPTDDIARLVKAEKAELTQPVIVRDCQAEMDSFVTTMSSVGIGAMIAVPLLAREARVGGLSVAAPRAREWTEDEVALVEVIGRQLGIIAERARLHMQVRQHAAELERHVAERTAQLRRRMDTLLKLNRAMTNLLADLQSARHIQEATSRELARANALITTLSQVAARLQASLDPDQILAALGSELKRLDLTCAVALLEPDDQTLTVRYMSVPADVLAKVERLLGNRVPGLRLPRERWKHSGFLDKGQPVLVTDWPAMLTTYLPGITERQARRGLDVTNLRPDSPLACLPLTLKGQATGVLAVWGEGLLEKDLPALSLFADQVAAALEVARLHEQLKVERVAEQATLLRLSQALLGETDPQAIMDLAAREAARALQTEFAAVALVDPDGQHYSAHARSGWPPEILEQVRGIPIDDTTDIGHAILTRTPVITPDVDWAPYFGAPEYITDMGVKASLVVPMLTAGKALGGLVVDSRTPRQWAEDHVRLLSLIANTAAQALERVRLFEQVRAGRQRLQTLSHRLVEVQEEERRRIARELHDQVGQLLTGLSLSLDMNISVLPDTARAGLTEARALVGELMHGVREMSLNLRPAMLDDLGLLAALLWHFERYTAMTDVQVDFKHTGLEGRRFPPGVETAAYRIVQEALTNVARHAGVREVSVRVWTDEAVLTVQIEDQGAGFDPEAALAAAVTCGLSGMYERAALLGGQLTIDSAPGAGTCVVAELALNGPVERRQKAR